MDHSYQDPLGNDTDQMTIYKPASYAVLGLKVHALGQSGTGGHRPRWWAQQGRLSSIWAA